MLEQKVKERTLEIEKKNQALEQLNNIKDKLFTIISHDLRQPITSFNVLLQAIKRLKGKMSEQKIESFASTIESHVTEVKDLLDNLLHWSQLQMEGQAIKPIHFDISKKLKKNVGLYTTIAAEKSININHEPNKEVMVWGDPDLSDVILRNLISNAVKFTEENGEITCKAEIINGNGQVMIKDSGIGIPSEIKDKFFLASENISTRGTANEKGIGLGLKLCKELIEKQGGAIQVESEVGSGSTICFTIPSKKIN